MAFVHEHEIRAGAVVTCVGSLEQYHLRFANQINGVSKKGHFEILSVSGTLSVARTHLHICLADGEGHTIGGHLLEKNLIYTTAEIVIAELTDLDFSSVKDELYGYHELIISPRQP
jgi:predicted DNA-binding protein with PD1-like motif